MTHHTTTAQKDHRSAQNTAAEDARSKLIQKAARLIADSEALAVYQKIEWVRAMVNFPDEEITELIGYFTKAKQDLEKVEQETQAAEQEIRQKLAQDMDEFLISKGKEIRVEAEAHSRKKEAEELEQLDDILAEL